MVDYTGLLQVKVKKLRENALLPTYGTAGAACLDFKTHKEITRNDWVYKGDEYSYVVETGLAFEIPRNHVMLVFSRSGHGFKHSCVLANSTGVIDSDYRGEVKIKLVTKRLFEIEEGGGVAQMIVLPYPTIVLTEVQELSDTSRGAGGFGSTDKAKQ
jgi:dUTP pyrophosphatase